MPDRDALARKVEHARASFSRPVGLPSDEHYLFVLEDTETGALMGTTGIDAVAGQVRPLYHFRHSRQLHHSHFLGLRRQFHTLTRCNHYRGCTEICSLYLRPAFRRANAGKLLSKVRFLFMAQYPERFTPTVIAEMRGVSDHLGRSPFWNWLRRHFVDLEFASVTQLVGAGHTEFIEELMPAGPLYTHLMDDAARAVIGQVHPDTRPALAMLEKEGFRHRGFVDLFDAGPTVECPLKDIASVRAARPYQLMTGTARPEHRSGQPVIIANGRTEGFRATITDQCRVCPEEHTVTVPDALARRLDLSEQAEVWLLPLTPDQARRPQPATQSHSLSAEGYGARPYAL
jgi:arginine N-succinyltransferase